MIELQDVTKVYNEGRQNAFAAIRGVGITVGNDLTAVFKGPSGSGKTTLLTLIGCLARPTSGRVTLNGETISGLPEKFLTEIRRKTFGFVFQRFNLIRGLSARENVMLPAYPLGLDHAALTRRADELLDHLGLGSKGGLSVEHLSGGEAQRVAIARALVNDPEYVIADEPTANLDTKLTAQFLDIVRTLRAEGKTVIMTSHDPRIWQADIVDRVITLEDGLLTADERGAHAA
ncbi:putative ABC transport system ATP-binding protein [Rhodobium orientis]|uniref:ABC transporter ATP-binding protein n=1 Tax=Rhodobium orientis TaxID=34017 RepID=A0A327JLD0_9HYPH|nr:ABC transporter ATP-binding protein [Rhodobium orientis]MBB4303869.1 putative ABC transport system ATP-binding protein [Rhodobium orientis]MBK5951416.1 ABC transporter ATP-binding protein [Rhodobium orientis]RAI26123.1 ABC transporter ATP-binding protein [Rhodobium orientis]